MELPPAEKFFAKKSFGQNFLVDERYVRKIIDALNPKKDDVVIEIGAGRGSLTGMLLEKAGRVIAVEFDRGLIPGLRERFGQKGNFILVAADALNVDFSATAGTKGKVKLVANLPYNISTTILQRLMEQRMVFSDLVLMFQREVVERITAKPGHAKRGFLTVLVEAYFDAEKLFDVPGQAFWPMPKVWSSVVRLIPKESEIPNKILFRKVVSIGFSQKRKTIFNNFKSVYSDSKSLLETSGIDPGRRAQTLTLEEWIRYVDIIDSRNPE